MFYRIFKLSSIRNYRHLWLITILILRTAFPYALQSQEYHTRQYTEADGLASSSVFQISQDKNGLMWFATRNGICNYDGIRWKIFDQEDGLPKNHYEDIFVDEKGVLWTFPIDEPLSLFAYEHGSWSKRYSIDGLYLKSPVTAFFVEYQNDQPFIMLATGNGLLVFEKGRWQRYDKRQGLPDSKINGAVLVDDQIWVATDGGLSAIRGDSVINDLAGRFDLPSKKLTGIAKDSQNNELRIYVSGVNWLGYIHEGEFHLLTTDFSTMLDNKYRHIFIIPHADKGIYFGNPFYLYYYNYLEDEVERIGLKSGLISEGATDVLIDREGVIWISGFRGVSKIPSMFISVIGKNAGLYEDEVTCILQLDQDEIVFAHQGALTFYKDGRFESFELLNNLQSVIQESRVQDLDKDANGNIWAAVSKQGLARIDPQKNVKWFDQRHGLGENIYSVLVDSKNRIWVSDGRLLGFNGRNFTEVKTNGIAPASVRKIFEGKNGHLYLATYSIGIVEYNGKSFQTYKCKEHINCNNNIFAFYEDSKGRKWVGGLNGLYLITGDSLESASNAGIQLNRSIYMILEDKQGGMWFGTGNGIYNWNGQQLEHYTINDGLAGQEVNRDAGLVGASGKVWIGTNKGVTIFNPAFKKNRSKIPPPKVDLLHVIIGNDTLDPYNEIKLSSREDDLLFIFRGISFLDENEVYYKCKLEGYEDGSWTSSFRIFDQEFRYANLPAGTYRFCLQAANKMNVWSEPVCSEEITISKVFYMQWWFRTLILLVFIAILILSFRFFYQRRYSGRLRRIVNEQTRELKASEQKLRELNQTKDRFFSIIAHDLKSPFNAILGLSEIIQEELDALSKEEIRNIAENLHTASSRSVNLLDNLLAWARSQRGDIPFHPEHFDLAELVRENISIFETAANKKKILLINLVNKRTPVYADRQMVSTIIRNLISNAIKFTYEKGRITIYARNKDGFIESCVKDNGKGMDEKTLSKLFKVDEKMNTRGTNSEAGTGLGLVLCKDFTERNNGSIRAESHPEQGTKICFTLPVGDKNKIRE